MDEVDLLGWATNALVRLDDQTPGLIARVLTAAPARRQAVFAALAVYETSDLHGADAEGLAGVLRHGRPADILRHAYGDVPAGFAGALSRIARPLERADDYIRLHALFLSAQPNVAEAVSAIPISHAKLNILTSLDPRWVHINVVSRLETSREAHTFNRAVAFLQTVCSRATDEALAEAIARMTPTSTLPRLLQRWLVRADRLPDNPVLAGDNELRPLTTLRDYQEVARRYHNCLATKLDEVVAGRMAIAEFRGEVLVEFRPLSIGKGWVIWTMHGHRNQPVQHNVAELAAARCEDRGIPRLDEGAGGDQWRSYRRITRQPVWGDWAA